MTELEVALGDRRYPIRIGSGLLADSAQYRPYVDGRQVMVVTNETVAPLYLDLVVAAMDPVARRVQAVVLPDGEAYKDWSTLNLIFDALLEAAFDRKCVLVALGGGVVGDMTGFAAACYQRGVDFIQIPTTLLAQVDSSVGGKTAVNHPKGKNMIGAFHQPRLVLTDLDVLKTLPDSELSAGLAEIIKTAAIRDAAFFAELEGLMPALFAMDPVALTRVIQRSCEVKAEVVALDEREGGLRAILNFGHTFGHAIEAGLGFGTWLHGEAVGAGMLMAADLSQRMGLLAESDVQRIRALCVAARLPSAPPVLPKAEWLAHMAVDKKAEAGTIKFVLLEGLGRAVVRTAAPDLLDATLRHFGAN